MHLEEMVQEKRKLFSKKIYICISGEKRKQILQLEPGRHYI